jgi:hydroxyacid-oxoacid transhydrogenase
MQMGETVFTWGAPGVKFGVGATDELGFDLRQLGIERVLMVTDPGVAATGLPERVRGLLTDAGLKAEVYDRVHVEPATASGTGSWRSGAAPRSTPPRRSTC